MEIPGIKIGKVALNLVLNNVTAILGMNGTQKIGVLGSRGVLKVPV